MQVTVRTTEGDLSFEAPTLEVARLVASAHGFSCECEPMEPGRVKLTARRLAVTINCSGTTVSDAAAKLIKGFVHD